MKTGISYYGNRSLLHFKADLQKIKKNQINYIVHTFSENDFYFYKDTVKEICRMTKKEKIVVQMDPWGVMGLFGGEAFSDIVNHKTKIRQKLTSGDSAAAACPNHPDTFKYMKKWIDAAAYCGAETLFWDEPHFYIPGYFGRKENKNNWGCHCKYCQGKFKEMFQEKFPKKKIKKVIAFQDECLALFLEKLTRYSAKKGCDNSICVLPHNDARERGFWKRVAEIKPIVSLGTDPYWAERNKKETQKYFDSFFSDAITELIYMAKDYDWSPHLWIQNFTIPKGRETDIRKAIQRAYQLGIRDFAAWSFYGGNFMSSLGTENPEAVWKTLGQSYQWLHKQRKA